MAGERGQSDMYGGIYGGYGGPYDDILRQVLQQENPNRRIPEPLPTPKPPSERAPIIDVSRWPTNTDAERGQADKIDVYEKETGRPWNGGGVQVSNDVASKASGIDLPPTTTDPERGGVDVVPELEQQLDRAEEEANNRDREAELRAQYAKMQKDQESWLNQSKSDHLSALDAQRDSALQQYLAEQARLREQSERALSKNVQPFDAVGSLNPLEQITGVSLDPNKQGLNAASQAFYLNPSSTQSQFTIGAPVGGGGIGTRQKSDTATLSSNTDTLGARRKDDI